MQYGCKVGRMDEKASCVFCTLATRNKQNEMTSLQSLVVAFCILKHQYLDKVAPTEQHLST